MDSDQQDKIAQFSSVTGADPSVAQNALGAANWDLAQAVALYFAANENGSDDEQDDDEPTASTTPAQPAAAAASSSSSRKPTTGGRNKQMKTLADLGGDDDEDEKDPAQDMFAGGEKSGLAVQNPDQAARPADHFRNIMNQARSNRERPDGENDEDDAEEMPRSTHFAGRAQTLGGDDTPSQVVQDPAAAAASSRPRHPRVTRTLHLWADGVSIDDGPLLRFDDPANEHIMQEINQGRAPKALLDVQPDQEVDLNLEPHKGENYVASKPKYKPFGGQGQRLGSPTPGLAPPTAATPASSSATTNESALAATTAAPPTMLVDDAQPTLQLQIRLGDGTRLVSRFNNSHTIGDVYDFVNRAAPTSQQRPWALMTTFPSKELDDKTQVLGDIGDFKRGGVVVQKWK